MAARKRVVSTDGDEPRIERSSGNVFADLGFPNAEERLAKADLALRIGALIRSRRLTQAQAALLFGTSQPKVSDLLRGKLEGFSTDRLFRFLNALDCDIEIVIKPQKRGRSKRRTPATIRVVEAA